MAARVKYELTVKTGEYTDRSTGQTKGKWQRIGTAFESDDGGMFISLDPWINLAGLPINQYGNVSVSCFTPKPFGAERPSTNGRSSAPRSRAPDLDEDELPF